VLCELPAGNYHGSWSSEGVILLGADGNPGGPLLRVAAAGGKVTPATTLDASQKEQSHRYPYFLPDGRHYLYLATSSDGRGRSVYIGELNSKERRTLQGVAAEAQYASGHLVFIRDGSLMAQPFDAERLELKGEASALANPFTGVAALTGPFSVSQTGVLAYRANVNPTASNTAVVAPSQLAWFDREGKRLALAGPPGEYEEPELSPDGKFVAFSRGAPRKIWMMDIEKSLASPLTSGPGVDEHPRWSPDGKAIAFSSNRDSVFNLYSRAVGVVAEDKLLLKSESAKTLSDWSADGKHLIYAENDDIWALPLSGDSKPGEAKPIQVTRTPERESLPRISRDGRWIAYISDKSKQSEVYIQSFPDLGFNRQVSTSGGIFARWGRDDRELFCRCADGYSVVSFKATGSVLTVGAPVFMHGTIGGTIIFGIAPNGRFLRQFTGLNALRGAFPGAAAPANPGGSGNFLTLANANAGRTQGVTIIFNWVNRSR